MAANVLVVMCGAAVLSASTGARDYLSRRVTYHRLAAAIAADADSPERIAERTIAYVWQTSYPGGGVVRDDTVLTNLVRGIGWCDQDVWTVGTLLATRGIPVRVVFVKDRHGASPHSMGEVFLDGKWRLVDPLLGIMFRRRDGAPATIDDLSSDPAMIAEQPLIRALPTPARRRVLALYARLIPLHGEPDRWIVESRTWSKGAIDTAIRSALAVLGPRSVDALQDWYLARLDTVPALESATGQHTRDEDPALFAYFAARNYDIYGRAALARTMYDQLISHYPESTYAEPARYYRAQVNAAFHHDAPESLALLREVIRRDPHSAWAVRSRYALGEKNERAGHLLIATRYYRQSSSDPYVPAAIHLASLRAGSSVPARHSAN
jgi:hypothetical protein